MLGMNHLFRVVAILFMGFSVYAQTSQHSVRVGVLTGIQNYQLQGTGFNASSTAAPGKGIDASYLYQSEQKIYFVKATSYESNVSTPNTVTPAEIKSFLKVYNLGISHVVKHSEDPNSTDQFVDECKFDLGLQYRERNSDLTTPNRLLPQYQTFGFRLGYQAQKAWSSMWKLEGSLGLFIPYFFDERTDKTGSLKLAVLPDLETTLVYKVNPNIDFTLGIRALYENLTYSGSGSRGVSEAKETYLNLIFPVELRFTF